MSQLLKANRIDWWVTALLFCGGILIIGWLLVRWSVAIAVVAGIAVAFVLPGLPRAWRAGVVGPWRASTGGRVAVACGGCVLVPILLIAMIVALSAMLSSQNTELDPQLASCSVAVRTADFASGTFQLEGSAWYSPEAVNANLGTYILAPQRILIPGQTFNTTGQPGILVREASVDLPDADTVLTLATGGKTIKQSVSFWQCPRIRVELLGLPAGAFLAATSGEKQATAKMDTTTQIAFWTQAGTKGPIRFTYLATPLPVAQGALSLLETLAGIGVVGAALVGAAIVLATRLRLAYARRFRVSRTTLPREPA